MLNTRYSCQILIELKFSAQSFKKWKIFKFYDSAYNGNRFVQLGQPNRRTYMTKIIVAILFLSFRRVVNVTYSFLGNSPASEI